MAAARRWSAVEPLRWLVIGAGPCGIMAVGHLVDHERRQQQQQRDARQCQPSVGWIDPQWGVGRLARYGTVPSNSPLAATSESRTVVPSLQCTSCRLLQLPPLPPPLLPPSQAVCQRLLLSPAEISRSPVDLQSQAERQAKGLPCVESMLRSGEKYSSLQLEIDALADATAVLRSAPEVMSTSARVTRLQKRCVSAAHWQVRMDDGGAIEAERVLLIPGAQPRCPPPALLVATGQVGVKIVHMDALLSGPSRQWKGQWIVVGAAHSGCMVAQRLLDGGARHVLLLSHREALHFTLPRENGYDKYRGSGLLGPTADWARSMPASAEFRHWPRAQDNDQASWTKLLQERRWAGVVFAGGFQLPDDAGQTLPQVTVGDADIHLRQVHHPATGDASFSGAPNLLGFGIGFPEVYTDPEGYSEPRSGFVMHFVEHLRQSLGLELGTGART